MEIDNHKISGRQLGRMVLYDPCALTTLLLPGILAKEAGMDGFFALAAGSVAGYGLLLLVLMQIRRMRQPGQDYVSYLQGHFGKVLTTVILTVYLLTAWFGAAYGLRVLCDISRQYLIRDTPVWLVLAVLAVLAVYGLGTGLESRGRMYEIVFWFVLLPLLFLFLLAVQNVEPDRWVPVFRGEGLSVLKSSYVVFAFLAGTVFLPMLSEGITAGADVSRVLKQGFAFSVCVNLVLFLVLTGIFGAPTVATMDEAVLTLTAMVKVPGGFLERQDALLCGIWLVSVFAFVENMLSYVLWCAKKINRKKDNRWCLPGAGALVYVAALAMYRSRKLISQLSRVYLRIAVPVLVGIVLVSCILEIWKNGNSPRGKYTAESARRNRKALARENMALLWKKSSFKEKNR